MPNLELLKRSLYAVSVDKVKEFLLNCNFMLKKPIRFVECLNPQVLEDYRREASEEDVEFFNMITPALHLAHKKSFDYFHFAEVLINCFKKTGDIKMFIEAVMKYLLGLKFPTCC